MKGLVACLVVLLVVLQYRLWFGNGNVQELWLLREQARDTRVELQQAQARNAMLEAEVRDLKSGLDAIEERARTDLGMIDGDETFYRFVRDRRAASQAASPPPPQEAAGDAVPVEQAESRPALHDADEPTGAGARVQKTPVNDG